MIKSFLALSECENITQAAEKLFFSQQALSKQISRLEAELGCQLIIRSRKGVKLTPEGEMYEKTFRGMMELLNSTKRQVDQLHNKEGNNISIGQLEMGLMPEELRNFYRNFSALYPEVSLTFDAYDDIELVRRLIDDSEDLVFVFNKTGKLDPEEYEVLPIYPVTIGVCINKSYPGASKWQSFEDIPDIPFIMNTNKQPEEIARVEEAGFSADKIIWSENFKSTLLNIDLLRGATLITDNTALTNNADLLFFPLPESKKGMTKIAAIWKKSNLKIGLRNFTNCLKSYVQSRGGQEN